jgi:hypothetical protein
LFVISTFNIFFIYATLNKSCVFIKSQTRKNNKHYILHCIEFALLLFSIIMTFCTVWNSPYFCFLLSWHTALYRIRLTFVFYYHDILHCIEFALLLFSIIMTYYIVSNSPYFVFYYHDILHCIEFALLLFSIIMTYCTVSNSPYFCFL